MIELAATGAAPGRELSAHLAICISCRAVAEREQSLFASIDAGLRQVVNTEVPSSFLPRLHERLAQESACRSTLIPLWTFATAATLVAIAAFWTLRVHQPAPSLQQAARFDAAAPRPPHETFVANSTTPPAVVSALSPRPRSHTPKTEAMPQVARREPEVLVPSDEREALARFVNALPEQREIARALLNPAAAQKDDSFPIELILIAGLEIQSLEAQREQEQSTSER